MRSLSRLLVALAAAVLLAATPAMGQAPSGMPVVGVILAHEQELGLSSAQVEALQRLGLDLVREVIRRRADLMIARAELWALLDREPEQAMDAASAEAKIRETAGIDADLQIALVRGIEAAKKQLTSDQRAKLTGLLAGASAGESDPPGGGEDVGAARGAGPSGAGSHTSGGRPPGGRPAGARPPVGPRPGEHGGRGFVRVEPFWWGPPYAYGYYPWDVYAPPPAAVEPPPYVQPEPSVYWYYCPSARAYYPNVPGCPEPWVLVAPRG